MCLDQSAGASTSESIHLLISNKKYMSNNNLKGKLKSQLTSNIHTQSSMNLTLFYNVIFKIDQCQPCRRSKKNLFTIPLLSVEDMSGKKKKTLSETEETARVTHSD